MYARIKDKIIDPSNIFQESKRCYEKSDKYGFLLNIVGNNAGCMFVQGCRWKPNLPVLYIEHNERKKQEYPSIEASVVDDEKLNLT